MQLLALCITAGGLGLGLAMDAFSVSLANGLAEPCGTRRRAAAISAVFGIFQGLMPLIGWFFVRFLTGFFTVFERFIPYVALGLLLFIGSKMIYDGLHHHCDECACVLRTPFSALLIQGVATSIDALSVGFNIAEYQVYEAVIAAVLIAVITFFICFLGVRIGRRFGTKLAGSATVFGGGTLILVGILIFVKSLLA